MRAFVLALAALLTPAAAGAHDFWIEPSTFAPVVAQRVDVGLCEGDGFDCRPLPRDDGRIEEFVAMGEGGVQRILGLHGYEPAGLARFTTGGRHTLVYRSHRAFTRLDAWRFEQHLAEKGLKRISALRRARGMSGTGAREAYSRYAKALLSVGDRRTTLTDRPLGLKLELVAESASSFRLLFEGQSLAGAFVTATRRDTAGERLEARTDASGRVTFALRDGAWLIAAVHMVEAPRRVEADWESFWASVTFELSPRSSRSFGAAAAVTRGGTPLRFMSVSGRSSGYGRFPSEFVRKRTVRRAFTSIPWCLFSCLSLSSGWLQSRDLRLADREIDDRARAA